MPWFVIVDEIALEFRSEDLFEQWTPILRHATLYLEQGARYEAARLNSHNFGWHLRVMTETDALYYVQIRLRHRDTSQTDEYFDQLDRASLWTTHTGEIYAINNVGQIRRPRTTFRFLSRFWPNN